MKIEILGPGCPNCKRLEEGVRRACRELGLEADIVKVTSWADIASYGVMRPPALVVDGEVVIHGRLPTDSEIKKALGR